MSLLIAVCRQVEVATTGQSLVQRIPTECVSVSLSVRRTCVSPSFHLRGIFIVFLSILFSPNLETEWHELRRVALCSCGHCFVQNTVGPSHK
jgi:hypothetical protein